MAWKPPFVVRGPFEKANLPRHMTSGRAQCWQLSPESCVILRGCEMGQNDAFLSKRDGEATDRHGPGMAMACGTCHFFFLTRTIGR